MNEEKKEKRKGARERRKWKTKINNGKESKLGDKITETPTLSISKMTNDKIAKNIETPLLISDHSQPHKEQQVQSSSKQRKSWTKEKEKKGKVRKREENGKQKLTMEKKAE